MVKIISVSCVCSKWHCSIWKGPNCQLFPESALITVSLFVWLKTRHSHPQRAEYLSLSGWTQVIPYLRGQNTYLCLVEHRSFPSSEDRTPIFVWLNTGHSHPQRAEHLSLSGSTQVIPYLRGQNTYFVWLNTGHSHPQRVEHLSLSGWTQVIPFLRG